MLTPILYGTLLGVSVAAPFGPVSLFCVQRSLSGRPFLGILSGLGAATAHGAFASLAIGSADIVAKALAEWRTPLQLLSAAVLIALGIRILVKRSNNQTFAPTEPAHTAYFSGLLLALANPMTILPYLAIATAITTKAIGQIGESLLLVPGVMFGASCWYAALIGGALLLCRVASRGITGLFNTGAGIAMIGFGLTVALGSR